MVAQGDREDKKLTQRSQLRQHGEFWHVSVSERQKLRVPFGTATGSRRERSTNDVHGETKAVISPPLLR